MSYTEQIRRDQLRTQTYYLQDQVAKLTREVSYDERRELEKAQARFDSVAAHTGGERASAPLPGETALGYRKRLVAKYQPQSAQFKSSVLYSLDSPTLAIVEQAVYHDAVEAAKRDVPAGQLKAVQERDAAGRLITKYYGDCGVWLQPYFSQGASGRINPNPPKKV